jgi:5-methylcytosine-specific restriction protein A
VPVARLEKFELSLAVDPVEDVTLQEFRNRAIAASKVDGSKDSKQGSRTIYERSRAVRDYVLQRAAGKCELCEQPAPFRRKGGLHYLEPHHTTRLSDGGPDHPKFVAALCPACHREVHYGEHAQEKNSALMSRLESLEVSDPN